MRFLLIAFLGLTACGKCQNCTVTHLVVYGDSISYGLNTLAHPTYADIIADTYGYNLEQKSVGGTDLENSVQYTTIMNDLWKPNTVIMYAPGLNDAILHHDDPTYLQFYHDALRNIVNKIHLGGFKAYIGTPIQTLDESRFVSNSIIAQYAQINRDIVTAMHDSRIMLVDYNALYKPTSSTDVDGIHPNALGYQTMAKYFFSLVH